MKAALIQRDRIKLGADRWVEIVVWQSLDRLLEDFWADVVAHMRGSHP